MRLSFIRARFGTRASCLAAMFVMARAVGAPRWDPRFHLQFREIAAGEGHDSSVFVCAGHTVFAGSP